MSLLLPIIAGPHRDALLELRYFAKGGMGQEWFHAREMNACHARALELGQTTDVFVGAAPRTHRNGGKAGVKEAWCLWADLDGPDAADRLADFERMPTLTVWSGTEGHRHAWWQLKHPVTPDWLERANRRLWWALSDPCPRCGGQRRDCPCSKNLGRVGADSKSTEAARILRIPGTLNFKTDPPGRVEVATRTMYRYSVAELVADLEDPPTVKPAPRRDVRPLASDDPLKRVSAEEYYRTLTGREVGRGNVQCPFHGDGRERNPSMRLYEDGSWHCFAGCGGGTVFDFGALLWGLGTRGEEFKELSRRLSEALL